MSLCRSNIVLLVPAMLLCACDFTAGVYRVSSLEEAPLPACVEQTLGRLVGAANVTYAPTELNGQPLHRFTYRAEGVKILVDIEREAARPEYIHYYRVFNTVPPEALVARLRPVMARVDEALERRCGISGLSRKAEEHCPRGPFSSTRCVP